MLHLSWALISSQSPEKLGKNCVFLHFGPQIASSPGQPCQENLSVTMPELSAMTQIEEELPSAEELMPLTQTLITPTLAFIFRIGHDSKISPAQDENEPRFLELGNPRLGSSARIEEDRIEAKVGLKDDQIQGRKASGSKRTMSSSEELENMSCSNENENENESEGARTLKRPRLVWTPQLHKRFVDAVHHLGVKNAVPKTIMQLMNVDGLTRENVASHLQKYRLYLKRLHHGLSSTPPTSPFLPIPTTSAFNKDSFLPFIVPTLPHFQFSASAVPPHPFSPPPVRSSQNSSAYDQGPSQRQLLNFLSTKGH